MSQNHKKIVIITGGSAGIGEACCDRFHHNNYHVINIDINTPQKTHGTFIQADLSDPQQTHDAFDQIKKTHKTIDVLVSNAGIHFSANIEQTSLDDYQHIIATNLTSSFLVIQATIQLMKQQGGRIITIGSDQSFIAKPNSTVYGMTKAAILQLTKSIAIDYAKYNITANCVCPGTIETPLYWQAIKKYTKRTGESLERIHEQEKQLQPAHRLGQPEEVASLIYYLAHDAGSFLLGSSIMIDGGYTTQ
ncbi:SDR family NAD(P)-dependent oxidoreductase [Facilibium subflavum]|uniref:SDR family NAD(P)-dependent oxidoreductase n=1 Tax=Facilibium subflavum TaxID=2219058 RepID=UPI000E64D012|nr:SDR family oxidoreductase [Facilibium subflavum]